MFADLRLPLMCAPMTMASSLALAVASCRAGIVGGWQGGNVRTIEEFERWIVALDEARRELAISYLRDARYSLSEITYLLGFSDASSFTHAFRRWTGRSPGDRG